MLLERFAAMAQTIPEECLSKTDAWGIDVEGASEFDHSQSIVADLVSTDFISLYKLCTMSSGGVDHLESVTFTYESEDGLVGKDLPRAGPASG